MRECVSTMLVDDGTWPDEVVCHVAADLFPGFISAGELVKLMEDRHDPEPGAWSFNWISQYISESVEAWSEAAMALRDGMADLIWCRRDPEQEPYHIRGEFSYLAPPLATLCDRQLSGMTAEPEPNLIRACVIASRFGTGEIDANKALGRLHKHFEEHTSWRSAGFWQELAFMDAIAPAADDWDRYYYAAREGLVGRLREVDRPWLEVALVDVSRPERRVVALHAVIEQGALARQASLQHLGQGGVERGVRAGDRRAGGSRVSDALAYRTAGALVRATAASEEQLSA